MQQEGTPYMGEYADADHLHSNFLLFLECISLFYNSNYIEMFSIRGLYSRTRVVAQLIKCLTVMNKALGSGSSTINWLRWNTPGILAPGMWR